MKPKYTTEALREKLFWELNNLICNVTDEIKEEALKIEGAGSITDGGTGNTNYTLQLSHHIDQLVPLFTAQQQALLDEVEKRLPEKRTVLLTGGTNSSAIPYENDTSAFNDGNNQVIDRVTETLEAIKKEII